MNYVKQATLSLVVLFSSANVLAMESFEDLVNDNAEIVEEAAQDKGQSSGWLSSAYNYLTGNKAKTAKVAGGTVAAAGAVAAAGYAYRNPEQIKAGYTKAKDAATSSVGKTRDAAVYSAGKVRDIASGTKFWTGLAVQGVHTAYPKTTKAVGAAVILGTAVGAWQVYKKLKATPAVEAQTQEELAAQELGQMIENSEWQTALIEFCGKLGENKAHAVWNNDQIAAAFNEAFNNPNVLTNADIFNCLSEDEQIEVAQIISLYAIQEAKEAEEARLVAEALDAEENKSVCLG